MRFRDEVLCFEVKNKIMLLGMNDHVIIMSGALQKKVSEAFHQKANVDHIFAPEILLQMGNSFFKELDSTDDYFESEKKLTHGDTQIEFSSLASKNDSYVVPVFAKHYDPTSIHGAGGYDDDTYNTVIMEY